MSSVKCFDYPLVNLAAVVGCNKKPVWLYYWSDRWQKIWPFVNFAKGFGYFQNTVLPGKKRKKPLWYNDTYCLFSLKYTYIHTSTFQKLYRNIIFEIVTVMKTAVTQTKYSSGKYNTLYCTHNLPLSIEFI